MLVSLMTRRFTYWEPGFPDFLGDKNVGECPICCSQATSLYGGLWKLRDQGIALLAFTSSPVEHTR